MKKNDEDKKKIFNLIKRLKAAKSIRNLSLLNSSSLEPNQNTVPSTKTNATENQLQIIGQNSFSNPKVLSENLLKSIKQNSFKSNKKNCFNFFSKSLENNDRFLNSKENLNLVNEVKQEKKNPKKTNKDDTDLNEMNCSICLRDNTDPALCNECLHCFCFTCIQQWSEQSNQCPVCRTEYSSILHNIRSDTEYETIPVSPRRRLINEFQIILPFRRNLLQIDRAINSMMDLNRFQVMQPGNHLFQTVPLSSNNIRRRFGNNETRINLENIFDSNRINFKQETPGTNYSFRRLIFEDPDDSFVFVQNLPLTQTDNSSINRTSNNLSQSLRRPKRNTYNLVRQYNIPLNDSFENIFDNLFNSAENSINQQIRRPSNNFDSFLDQVLFDFNQVNGIRSRNSSNENQNNTTPTTRTNYTTPRPKRNTRTKRVTKRSKSKKKK